MASYQVQIDETNRVVVVAWEGEGTLADAMSQLEEVSPTVKPGYGLLMDLTLATANIPKGINSQIAPIRAKHTYISAIVAPDAVTYGSCCQFASMVNLRGGGEVAVFRSRTEADDWLVTRLRSMPACAHPTSTA